MTEIYFNSKSKQHWKLSNFYGGVEANYMKDRFLDYEVRSIFMEFETCNTKTFMYYLQKLQPNKTNWTPSKINYWMKEGKPIRGILSQLVGTSVKETGTGKRRLNIVKELVGIQYLNIKPNTSDQEKKTLMLKLLKIKFSKKEYAEALLSTGDAILHEKPIRGRPNSWTYKDGQGGDWLGQLLMIVRAELKN